MSTVLVIGATGKQGGAVGRRLLERGHTVLAYVRNPESEAARSLTGAGAELVPGDLADPNGLGSAAAGTDAISSLTVPSTADNDAEMSQGRLLIDAAADAGTHLVYSSVRGADRLTDSDVAHAGAKQLIEAQLRDRCPTATVLGPTYFMENLANVDFTGLRRGVYATPLSADKPLDMVTVLDIAAMAVHAIENPGEMAGRRIDLTSDRLTGRQVAHTLGDLLGRDIPYQQLPLDQVRAWAGPQVATMFEKFEANTSYVDTATLHRDYPELGWHSFTDWAARIDWERLIAASIEESG